MPRAAAPSTSLIRLSPKLALDYASPLVRTDGFRAWVTGQSGAGKSNTVMLIMEQWLANIGQLLVFDVHGEYGNLWDTAPAKVVRIGYGDQPVGENSVSWVVELIRTGHSVLIDLRHWAIFEVPRLTAFIEALLKETFKLQLKRPKQLLVVAEEAQNLIPQQQSSGQYELVKLLINLITGGRKFGMNFVLASQRQALVDRNAITQCNVRLFHGISDVADWKPMKDFLPDKWKNVTWEKSGKTDISKFLPGEAVLVSKFFPTQRVQVLRSRVAVHKYLEE